MLTTLTVRTDPTTRPAARLTEPVAATGRNPDRGDQAERAHQPERRRTPRGAFPGDRRRGRDRRSGTLLVLRPVERQEALRYSSQFATQILAQWYDGKRPRDAASFDVARIHNSYRTRAASPGSSRSGVEQKL